MDPTAPVGQFDKLSFDVNAIKVFDLGWNSFNPRFDIQGNGVLSADSLFGTEQISIGGPFSVRGFKNDSISGDRGGHLRADVSTALPAGGVTSFGLTYTKPISSPKFMTQESEELFLQLSVTF